MARSYCRMHAAAVSVGKAVLGRRAAKGTAMGAVLLAAVALGGLSGQAAAETPSTNLEQANGPSFDPAISGDGRYVAFRSAASNMLDEDTNGADDIFLADRTGDTTSRVSLSSAAAQANGSSSEPAISADGRYVAFRSSASNLVGSDTNGSADIFIHDTTTGSTTRISVDGAGVQANGPSSSPSVSSDGRYVAFRSGASNLVSGDTNAADDVFVRDRSAGTTTRMSVSSSGAQATGASGSPAISGDGGSVAFDSAAPNLAAGDTNSREDVFVRNVAGASTTRVSVDSGGSQGYGQSSSPSISSDGDRVAFQSTAGFAGDSSPASDIYVRDRSASTTTWATRWVAANQGLGTGGASTSPAISGDGRYVALVLDPDIHITDVNSAPDLYEYDLATAQWALLSHDDVNGPGNRASGSPSLSSDATYTAFESLATNFHVDTNEAQDVFAHRWIGNPVTGRLESGQSRPDDEPTEQPAPRHCSIGKPAASSTAPPSGEDSAEGEAPAGGRDPRDGLDVTTRSEELAAATGPLAGHLFCEVKPVSPPRPRPKPVPVPPPLPGDVIPPLPDEDEEEDPTPVPPPPIFPGRPDEDETGDLITIYRGVGGDKNANRVYHKPKLSPNAFSLDADGVSTWRGFNLPPGNPYIVPFHVKLPRPGAALGRLVELPACEATYTPEFGAGHWSINCVPRGDTHQILSRASKGPPIRQWIKCNPEYTFYVTDNGCID